MVAGPWFTVRQDDGEWGDFGTVWTSDGGTEDGLAKLQLRLKLEELPPVPAETATTVGGVEVADAG